MVIYKEVIASLKKQQPKIEEWIQEAFLSEENEGYLFSLKDEDKLIWKKQTNSNIKLTITEIKVESINVIATHKEMFDVTIGKLKEAKSEISLFKNKSNKLSDEKKALIVRMEQMTREKLSQESDLYSHFLPILNAKKDYIRQLEEDVKILKTSKNPSSSQGSESKTIHTVSSSDEEDVLLDNPQDKEKSMELDDSQNFLNLSFARWIKFLFTFAGQLISF